MGIYVDDFLIGFAASGLVLFTANVTERVLERPWRALVLVALLLA